MHLPEGTILQNGRYKIIRFIKSGGFGCTYEGAQTMMGARVAIKELFISDFCNREEDHTVKVGTKSKEQDFLKFKRSFVNEASSLFKMRHPNIVRVTDLFEENGTAYYVMEFIDGDSLADIVSRRGILPEKESVGYILQVCDALKYVHSQNRMHMDIKPGNIMVDKNGDAILIDFGASKYYDEESGEQTSTLMGVYTKGYAPFEQIDRSFNIFNPPTDIYALGATLYKLVTGITPPDSLSLLSRREVLKPLPEDISPATRRAIMAAMQLDIDKRPQTIEEFECLLTDSEEKTELEVKAVGDDKTEAPSEVKMVGDIKPEQDVKSVPNNKPQPKEVKLENKEVILEKAEVKPVSVAKATLEEENTTIDSINDTPKNTQPSVVQPIPLQKDQEEEWLRRMRNERRLQAEKNKKRAKIIDVCVFAILLGCLLWWFIGSNNSIDSAQEETKSDSIVKGNPIQIPADGTINGHEYVDLGLPSQLKWASCNVGATSPLQRGGYYAWGETITKSSYTNSNSEAFLRDREWLFDHGYINESGNLTPSHDVANQKWGESWRMPTLTEIKELIKNTTYEFVVQDGVGGFVLTSKLNGNSIFLPACGIMTDTILMGGSQQCYYWSSTLEDITDNGTILRAANLFLERSEGGSHWYQSEDDYGFSFSSLGQGLSVRPVSD